MPAASSPRLLPPSSFVRGTLGRGPQIGASPIRVALVEHLALVRDGLRALLTADGGCEVVAETDDGAIAIAVVQRTAPQLLLLDLAIPSVNGLDVLRQLQRTRALPPAIVMSVVPDPLLAAQAFSVGARGFLSKRSSSAELFEAISAVHGGGEYLGRDLDAERVRLFRRETGWQRLPSLTAREQEVLRMVAGGANSGTIASALTISPHTAVRHRANLMRKLGVHNRAELLKRARELALVT